MKRSATAIVLAAGLCAPVSAMAQCPGADWLYSPLQGLPGISGPVSVVGSWDPDGAGPQPANLVAGGTFSVAGAAAAKNVAMWDGTSWQALGPGVPGTVQAITTFNGSLVIGGTLDWPYNGIARWDGSAWQPMAQGIAPFNGPTVVRSLTVFNGDLYAGGLFAGEGLEAINGSIARWDGAGWRDVAGGVSGNSAPHPLIESMQVYDSSLIVAGRFTGAGGLTVGRIARWDGTAWSKVGIFGVTSSSPDISTLSVYNGTLYAAGTFSAVDAISPMGNVATWNGTTWAQVNGAAAPISSSVRSSTILNGTLYFATGGSSLYSWNGAAFANFSTPGPTTTASSVTGYNGQLIFGSEGSGRNAIARREGTTWKTLGNGMFPGTPNVTDPRPIVAYNGGVAFSDDAFSPTDTSTTTSGVAFWDGGTNLTRLGGQEWSGGSRPRALIAHKGQLFAAGQQNGAVGGCVSVLNGGAWQGVGSGTWNNGRVSALTIFNGELVAGGNFTTAAGIAAARVAHWTGSSWQPFGGGVGVSNGEEVRDLAVYNGQLYATGNFSNGNLARWNGASWQVVSIGLNQMGYALAVYNNRLYVGGVFTLAGGNAAHGMAYWDGVTLVPDLGGSIATYSLLSAFGNLYAGGFFQFIGNTTANNIAVFNGVDWLPIGNGIGAVAGINEAFPAVRGLAAYQTQVIAAGDFLGAGNGASASWARYGCPTTSTCYANCDGSTVAPILNANDFQCFLNQFAAIDPNANCDGSTVAPILNANDFQCFLNAFAAGCS